MLSFENFISSKNKFIASLDHLADIKNNMELRRNINKFVYTCQQSIGATLDALPARQANTAKKINGDLFERLIRIILNTIGIEAKTGVVSVPIYDNGTEIATMTYQHDLILKEGDITRAIGSVKTSSKDRLDKIFIDKFVYNHITGTKTPHFAIFLNDVQRKGKSPRFGINSTFLSGHFKGYTLQLNPLDGVYYCDLRPNMETDAFLKTHIHGLDHLLVEDIWKF